MVVVSLKYTFAIKNTGSIAWDFYYTVDAYSATTGQRYEVGSYGLPISLTAGQTSSIITHLTGGVDIPAGTYYGIVNVFRDAGFVTKLAETQSTNTVTVSAPTVSAQILNVSVSTV